MAFSQAQKVFLNLLTSQPYDVFKKIMSGEVKLETYQNEFFKDGSGLLHILSEAFLKSPKEYYPILKFILDDKHLTLSDHAKGKSGANLILIDHYNDLFLKGLKQEVQSIDSVSKEGEQFLYYYYQIIKDNTSSFSPSHCVDVLATLKILKKDNLYEELLPYVDINKNTYQSLMKSIIKLDDIKDFKRLVTIHSDIPYNFEFYSFFTNERTYNEYSNILTYALYYGAKHIASHIIEHNMAKLNGKCGSSYSFGSTNTKPITVDCLTQALISNDLENYKSIFLKIDKKDYISILTNSISITQNQKAILGTDDNNLKHWDLLLDKISTNSEFYDFVIENKDLIIDNSSSIDAKSLLELILTTVSYEKDLEKVKFTLEKLLKNSHIGSEIFNPPPIMNRLISVFQSSLRYNIVEDKEYNTLKDCIEILDNYGLLYFENSMMYNKDYFTNEKLFLTLIEAGIDYNCNYHLGKNGVPHNILEIYLLNKEVNNYSTFNLLNSNEKDAFDVELSNHNRILKHIIDNIGNHIYIRDFNHIDMIGNALQNQNYSYLNLLNPEHIKAFSKSYASFANKIISPQNENNKIQLEKFLTTCIDCNISFFSQDNIDIHPFYQLLNKNINLTILDIILEKENKTIFNLSNSPKFWENVSNPYISRYVLEKGANYNNKEITLHLAMKDLFNSLELYISHGGNIYYQDEKNRNLLHILLKEKRLFSANIIFEFEPLLAQQTDKNNKFPLSYILQDYDKMCENSNKAQSSYEKSKYEVCTKLLINMFSTGLNCSKNKSMKFVEEQLLKYKNIEKYHPEITEYLFYGQLENKIPIIDVQKKKKKI